MSVAGLPVFQLSLRSLRGSAVGSGLVQAWSRPVSRKAEAPQGHCSLGFDNLALPYSATRNCAARWVDSDEAEYEDEE